MNLRCIYCQTPFTLGRMEKLAAIQKLQAEEMHHYDVFCPRCRRANTVSIERLQIFTPGWKEGLKTLETEAAQAEKSRAAVASVAAAVKSAAKPAKKSAPSKKRHASKASKASKPAAKAPAKKKPAAAKKTTTKAKPAAKKSKKK
jgi:phage FluMu protein Com